MEFEEWARLLITRKVPRDCSHLIDSEVIHRGARILRHGGAFEVRLESEGMTALQGRITIQPMPSLRQRRN